MNTENRPGEFEFDLDRRRSLIDYHREASADEIDLGELIRNLFGEWRIIALVIAIGAILAIASASPVKGIRCRGHVARAVSARVGRHSSSEYHRSRTLRLANESC